MSVVGSSASFPAEIIRMILENFDLQKDSDILYELSLTSKLFSLEATSLLYRNIAIEDGEEHYKFLSTIQRKPELAALVRKYHAPLSPGPKNRPFWPHLRRCLSLMTGLKELAYPDTWKEMKLGIPRVKKGQPFPFQLEKFIWRASLSRRGDGHRNELLKFFETQHNLQYLICTNSDLAYSIPAGCFPNLKVVEGDTGTIKALVPTRHTITEVYWKGCSSSTLKEHFGSPQSMFRHRDTIFAKVRGLFLEHEEWFPFIEANDRLLQVFLHLASREIQVLEIHQRFDPMSEVLLVPPRFPKLKRLCLRLYYITDNDIDFDYLRPFLYCPDLICLDLWVTGRSYYSRWDSRDARPITVTIAEEDRLRLPDPQQ